MGGVSDEEERGEWSQWVALSQFVVAWLTITLLAAFVLGKVVAWW